jgi:cobyrinic acid a,c-diamide synthase
MTSTGTRLKHRIGLAYLPGALPCFEAFGNLPTDLVRIDGLVDKKPASEVLDMIIIPGGSLVESQTVTDGIEKEIRKMSKAGKFVLGICSGFQVLSRGTDIGRLSPTPIFRPGMGLIDVEFKPLICTDQVGAKIVGASWLTDEVGTKVTGFHCHTYGDIKLHGKSSPVLSSKVKRLNYFRDPKSIISGAANEEGNVVGVLTHALLDQNPAIIRGITKSLGISQTELDEIRRVNAKLQVQMKDELGIATGLHIQGKIQNGGKRPRSLLITALESGGGKTVVATGLAGALRKRGWNVGVIKIGGDIRDIVPALYLTKEPMRDYSSLYVADTGWKSVSEMVKGAERDYDFVLIEGAMNAFTGLLYDRPKRPNSTAELAAALGVPTIVVAGCDKEGIEGGIVSALNYVRFLKKLGIETVGVILNKVYLNYMSDETRAVVKQAFEKIGAEVLGIMPVSDLEGRGVIPEVEIKYEEFTAKALELVEQSVNLDRIVEVSVPFVVTDLDYEAFVAKFKKLL